jgi:beta-phosphoglucomutase-like phosphatase (HAD superfamily)
VDGTLADTERDGHRPAFNAAFREYGLDWDWDVALYGQLLAVTGGKERMRYYVERFRPDYAKPADFDDLVAQLHKAKTRALHAHAGGRRHPACVPASSGLLEARARGPDPRRGDHHHAGKCHQLLRHSLAEDGPEWFAVIAAGRYRAGQETAPDIYVWAMQQLGLAPDECLAFEDSENGIRASLGANLRTVVTINDYTREHDFSGALAVLSDLGEPGQRFTRLDAAGKGEQGVVDLAQLRALAGLIQFFSASAASSVFCNSVATVIGPTPPGTGVIQPARIESRLELDIAGQPCRHRQPIDADVDHEGTRLESSAPLESFPGVRRRQPATSARAT